jgi:hypothetical protein
MDRRDGVDGERRRARRHAAQDLRTGVWEYDRAAPLRPWRVRGGLDAVFTPFYDKKSAMNLGVVSSRTDQCFGTWSGTFAGDGGVIAFDGIEGFAEDVRNRW